jgi:hypothetical protein
LHLGPGTERDSASNPTWPSWKEYDLVECGGDRQGDACNVHYGTTNTQTGPQHFDGDLTQWHVFGCELFDNGVRYLLDGKVVKELTGANVMSNHIHRLGIQLDVGRQPGERRRAGVRRLGQSCQGGSVSMNGHGPIGTVPDLGAVRARQQEKAAGPDYDPGTPEFAIRSGSRLAQTLLRASRMPSTGPR